MRRLLAAIVSLAVLVSPAGCTSQKTAVRPDAQVVAESLRLGDQVNIRARNGKQYSIIVGEIGGNYVRGHDPATGKIYRIPFDQIVVLDHQVVDPAATALGIGATAVVLYSIAAIVAVIALFRAGDDFGDSLDDLFGGGRGC